MVETKICEHVRKLEPVMIKRMDELIVKHNSLKQGRVMGLFGAFDLVGPDGGPIQKLFNSPNPESVVKFKKKLFENGIFTWVRPPVLHIAPPLVINEVELNTLFDKLDDALTVLDH
jgi:taurine--2-oxoglutarate transaminase